MSRDHAYLATPTTADLFALAWPLGLTTIMLYGVVVIDAYLVSALGEAALAARGWRRPLRGCCWGCCSRFPTRRRSGLRRHLARRGRWR